jgi:broad specificity phosphatase PhoE
MTRVIWLARHGNREDFVDPGWRERAPLPDDPPLSADGVEQARRLARRLRGEPVGAIYTSPFLRAVQTADAVAEALGLRIRVEPGFGEHLNPEWFPRHPELHPISELTRRYPRIDPEYRPSVVPTYPETTAEAHRRAAQTVASIAGQSATPVLFVGHGASVSGTAWLLAHEDRETPCPLTGVFKLLGTGKAWKVELRADTSHLVAAQGADRFH